MQGAPLPNPATQPLPPPLPPSPPPPLPPHLWLSSGQAGCSPGAPAQLLIGQHLLLLKLLRAGRPSAGQGHTQAGRTHADVDYKDFSLLTAWLTNYKGLSLLTAWLTNYKGLALLTARLTLLKLMGQGQKQYDDSSSTS